MHRAAYRRGVDETEISQLLDAVTLIDLNPAIRERSHRIGEQELRSQDAIHLATAALLGEGVGVVFTYDDRMQNSGLMEGLPIWAPRPG